MTAWNLDHLDDLLLARLCVPRKVPYTRAELPKLVGRYLEHAATPAETRALLDASAERLLAAGRLAPPLEPTDAGRRRAEAVLGGAIPARARWDALERRGLLPAALGRPGDARLAERIATPEGLQAVLLAEAHELGAGDRPTLTQALDALVWQALGVPEGGRLSLEKLRVWALERALKGASRGTSKQLARRAAAVATRAKGTDPAALRRAVVARWLAAPDAAPGQSAGSPSQAERGRSSRGSTTPSPATRRGPASTWAPSRRG